jgi:hypothetical protein
MLKLKNFRKVLAILMSLGAVGGFGLAPGVVPKPTVLAGPEDERTQIVKVHINRKFIGSRWMHSDLKNFPDSITKHFTECVGPGLRLRYDPELWMVSRGYAAGDASVSLTVEEANGSLANEEKCRMVYNKLFDWMAFKCDVQRLSGKSGTNREELDFSQLDWTDWDRAFLMFKDHVEKHKLAGDYAMILSTKSSGVRGLGTQIDWLTEILGRLSVPYVQIGDTVALRLEKSGMFGFGTPKWMSPE